MTLTEHLTQVLDAHADSVRADIQANSGGTDWDHRQANEAEAKYDALHEAFTARLEVLS